MPTFSRLPRLCACRKNGQNIEWASEKDNLIVKDRRQARLIVHVAGECNQWCTMSRHRRVRCEGELSLVENWMVKPSMRRWLRHWRAQIARGRVSVTALTVEVLVLKQHLFFRNRSTKCWYGTCYLDNRVLLCWTG